MATPLLAVLALVFFVAWQRAKAYNEWARVDMTHRLVDLSETEDGREELRAMGFHLSVEDDEEDALLRE